MTPVLIGKTVVGREYLIGIIRPHRDFGLQLRPRGELGVANETEARQRTDHRANDVVRIFKTISSHRKRRQLGRHLVQTKSQGVEQIGLLER